MPSPLEGGAPEAATGPSRSPSGAARAGGAGPGSKSQVVQVVLANGNSQVRLAELDAEAGKLVLWQLNEGENGELDLGNQASIKLAVIGDATVEDSSVVLRAGGPSGRMLMRLDFSDEELARAWAPAIRSARSGSCATSAPEPAPAPASPAAHGGAQSASDEEGDVGGSHADMLRVLIDQLQQQATLLELINKRKEDQLYELQAELEWALQRLQEGQEEYARQHRDLESNQQVIEGFRQRAQAAGAAEAACTANAAQAAAGAAAAARAGATGPLARAAPAPAALGSVGGLAASRSPATPASPAGPTLASPAAAFSPAPSPAAGAGGSKAPAPSPQAGPQPMDKESEQLAQQQLLDKLRALEDEKGRLERELAEEQGEVQSQLRDLQGMMAALGL